MWTHDITIGTAKLDTLQDELGLAITDAERDGRAVVILTLTAPHVERESAVESIIEIESEA